MILGVLRCQERGFPLQRYFCPDAMGWGSGQLRELVSDGGAGGAMSQAWEALDEFGGWPETSSGPGSEVQSVHLTRTKC